MGRYNPFTTLCRQISVNDLAAPTPGEDGSVVSENGLGYSAVSICKLLVFTHSNQERNP
jgi:hypothetical protein